MFSFPAVFRFMVFISPCPRLSPAVPGCPQCAGQSAAHEVCWLRSDGVTGVALKPPCESTTRNLHRARCSTLTGLRVCMIRICGICGICGICPFWEICFGCSNIIQSIQSLKDNNNCLYELFTASLLFNLCLSYLCVLFSMLLFSKKTKHGKTCFVWLMCKSETNTNLVGL